MIKPRLQLLRQQTLRKMLKKPSRKRCMRKLRVTVKELITSWTLPRLQNKLQMHLFQCNVALSHQLRINSKQILETLCFSNLINNKMEQTKIVSWFRILKSLASWSRTILIWCQTLHLTSWMANSSRSKMSLNHRYQQGQMQELTAIK